MVILSVLTIKILSNFVICLKVIEYCKSATFQLKIKLSSLNFRVTHCLITFCIKKIAQPSSYLSAFAWVCAKLIQWCPTPCSPMEHSLPAPLSMAGILKRAAMPSSGESSQPCYGTHIF